MHKSAVFLLLFINSYNNLLISWSYSRILAVMTKVPFESLTSNCAHREGQEQTHTESTHTSYTIKAIIHCGIICIHSTH